METRTKFAYSAGIDALSPLIRFSQCRQGWHWLRLFAALCILPDTAVAFLGRVPLQGKLNACVPALNFRAPALRRCVVLFYSCVHIMLISTACRRHCLTQPAWPWHSTRNAATRAVMKVATLDESTEWTLAIADGINARVRFSEDAVCRHVSDIHQQNI